MNEISPYNQKIIIKALPCRSLRIESIEVPAAVPNGTQVTLACNYDLQNDQVNRSATFTEVYQVWTIKLT